MAETPALGPLDRSAAAAKVYDAGLNQNEDVVVPPVAPDSSHIYHLYTTRHPRRDALAAHLNAQGVQTAINYPTTLPCRL